MAKKQKQSKITVKGMEIIILLLSDKSKQLNTTFAFQQNNYLQLNWQKS